MGVGAAHAVVLGEPGEALLVPYVVYDTTRQLNTLVGVTSAAAVGPSAHVRGTALGGSAVFPTVQNVAGPTYPVGNNIHWFFFDEESNHMLDNGFNMTGDDWHGFDWGATVQAQPAAVQTLLDGQLGYLVFSDERARTGGVASDVALYGDAVVIAGNWASAAFVPVVPLSDGVDGAAPAAGDNVVYGAGGIPTNVSPIDAGTPRDDDSGTIGDVVVRFDMRYFLDPALNGTTNLVFWNDTNNVAPWTILPVEVFDTEENQGSFQLDFSNEVNEVDASTLAWTNHTSADGYVNSGFVRIDLPETADAAAPAGPDTSFVAFSLIGFGTGANANQVQTALAHERGAF
jgi:hypothetical protein